MVKDVSDGKLRGRGTQYQQLDKLMRGVEMQTLAVPVIGVTPSDEDKGIGAKTGALLPTYRPK